VTALGKSVDETWCALLEGMFIRDHARCSTGFQPVPSRVTGLALAAANEAIAAARWDPAALGDDATALIVGTSKGPIERWMTAPPVGAYGTNEVGSVAMGLHEVCQSLAREYRFGYGPRATLSSACASGLHALIQATMLLQSGVAKRALVVAAEASVHPLFVGSFKRLGVLPPEGFGCRPFDEARAGFLMSEASAAVCLETDHLARPMGRGICRIDGFALGADATHLTGVDPAGKTLRRLLANVIDNRPIDLIHAHATGTAMNDPIELAAIEDTLPATDHPTWLYSHKGALGHSLGAAGLLSVVLNIESHRRGLILPNVQTRNPLRTRRVVLNREAAKASVHRSLAIAAGFGGPTAVVSCVSA
jgi:3-oxoacyl-[acyl-carrier-protein] synthase II